MSSHRKPQVVYLTGNDESSSFPVNEDNIVLHASSNSTESRVVEASNKVKINPIVRFDWDKRAYFGRVIAVHKHGQFVAYSLKPAAPPGGGAVRVIHLATAIKHLMKGFNGRVVDLDFSCRDQPTLACIDENGLVVVYTIDLNDTNLEAKRILQIVPAYPYSHNSELRRLRWCPYVPGPDSGGASWLEAMLAVSHGSRLELFDVDFLARNFGNGTIKSENLKQGYLSIEEHTKAITEIAPSPDGFAIATSSLDGSVNFYELPEHLQSNFVLNRMYHWKPHDGNPVTTLIFLDDRRPGHKTNLWCNALTATHDGRELSIWSCDRWEIIQRISIRGPLSGSLQDSPDPPGKIFVRSDLSGRLIVLSDVTRSVLYVLELEGAGGADAPVYCHGIHEFVLASTCLDLAVMDVKRSENESSDGEGHISSMEIEAAGIYPKSLQSMQIHFNSVLATSDGCALSNGATDEEEVENDPENDPDVVASSSLTGVSPVSSMLTGLGMPSNGPMRDLDRNSPPQQEEQMSAPNDDDDDDEGGPDVLSRNSTLPGTSVVMVDEEEEPQGRNSVPEEWPAAPELHICDVLSSRTSSSGGGVGGINVAVVAPRETGTSLGPCDESPPIGVGDVQEQLRQMDIRSPLSGASGLAGPDVRRSSGTGRDDDDEDDEDEIPEVIEGLSSRNDNDSGDGDEEDENEDELCNDEEEAATTENGGYQEDDEGETSGDDEDMSQPMLTLQPAAPLPTAILVSASPSNPRDQVSDLSSGPLLHSVKRTDTSPPAWAASLLSQMNHQAEQVASLQGQLAAERQERVEMMELLRRLEASSGRLGELSAQGRNEMKNESMSTRATMVGVGDKVISQSSGLRLIIEQKLTEHQRNMSMQQEQLFQKMVNDVSAKVYHSVLSNLNSMLRNEISSVVVPNVQASIDDVRTNLSSLLQDKLGAMDAVIREQINKVLKHKNTMDMIGRSTAEALRRSVTTALEEQTRNFLLPEVNAALHRNANTMRDLLRKTMDEFQNGMNTSTNRNEVERRDHLEGLLSENKRAIDKQLTTSLRHLENSLEGYISRLSKDVTDNLTQMSTEVRTAVASVPTTPTPSGDMNRHEMSASPYPRQSGLNSPQPIEISTQTLRKQMMSRLANEQYTKALNEVLTHTRPELLTEFCRLVAPHQIFETHQPQNVVLSLLSQLTNTLHQDTENKLKFIMEAFVHLDENDPTYKTYGPKTMSQMKKKVEMLMRDTPYASYQSSLRFLMMTLNSR